MSRISLTSLGVTFITLTFIFMAYKYAYGLAEIVGYNTDGLNETVFDEIGDQERLEGYLNDTSQIQEDTTADKTSFDIIGDLIATALSPVRTIINGANFLIGGVGKLLGYIGIPTIVNDFVTGLISFIIGTIFLFAIVLGRKDKND